MSINPSHALKELDQLIHLISALPDSESKLKDERKDIIKLKIDSLKEFLLSARENTAVDILNDLKEKINQMDASKYVSGEFDEHFVIIQSVVNLLFFKDNELAQGPLGEKAEKLDLSVGELDFSELVQKTASDFTKDLALLQKELTPSNARETLVQVKALGFPKSISTFEIRLACLRADPTIETWEAFTTVPNETLQALKKESTDQLKKKLREKNIWIPEIEGFHLKIIQNMLIKLGRALSSESEAKGEQELVATKREVRTFQNKMLKPVGDLATSPKEGLKKNMITVARGAPSAGKTSFLQGQFALACDNIKIELLESLRGLTPAQTHYESSSLLETFRSSAEKHFQQSLTTDALFVTGSDIEGRLADAKANGQQIRMSDMQVDFKTLCCRILKRGPYEPRPSFENLSKYFRESIENRKQAIELVQKNSDVIKEFKLSAWNGKSFEIVAELDNHTGKINISNPLLYEKITNFDPAQVQAELKDMEGALVTEEFIKEFTSEMPPQVAEEFSMALSKFVRNPLITFNAALTEHSKTPILELSAGARSIGTAESPFKFPSSP